ncbi:hypothetical protein KDH_15020 [Dictyobacter sp. S3.2.2.5]|uniref:Uncharacterized protein n=2 Tax=Dictyobacter TaxID=2024965 RepID=A0A401ZQ52_9CHLR|nr:hypothetical protein [Dictyobacter aurantiacus]GCE08904.1 hypothetical protein KDAU_62330 [Dictyobacter aurantiacus]GLV54655.1 hypothetical protein KDH_15020 [Dictyobacter sp. S3.2.2.5]
MSEVAKLRQQIELELVAMRRGLSGLSCGDARHAFIRARMDRVGVCQDRLAHHLGESDATLVVCELYIQTMEEMERVAETV